MPSNKADPMFFKTCARSRKDPAKLSGKSSHMACRLVSPSAQIKRRMSSKRGCLSNSNKLFLIIFRKKIWNIFLVYWLRSIEPYWFKLLHMIASTCSFTRFRRSLVVPLMNNPRIWREIQTSFENCFRKDGKDSENTFFWSQIASHWIKWDNRRLLPTKTTLHEFLFIWER